MLIFRVENEEHDKGRTQQHGFIREPPLREHMVRSEGSWELETYFMCATIYYQSTISSYNEGQRCLDTSIYKMAPFAW